MSLALLLHSAALYNNNDVIKRQLELIISSHALNSSHQKIFTKIGDIHKFNNNPKTTIEVERHGINLLIPFFPLLTKEGL